MSTTNTTLRQTFLNAPQDCQWLRETHLSPRNLNGSVPFAFRSFIIHGNEDCPQKIDIYAKRNPMVTDAFATAVLGEDFTYSFVP